MTNLARPRVALALAGIGELAGGGGAERFFADVYARYRARNTRRFELAFITDPRSAERLRHVGALPPDVPVVELAPRAGAADAFTCAARLLQMGRDQQFELLHIALLSRRFFPYLCVWRFLTRSRRPALAVSVVDCTVAHTLEFPSTVAGMEQRKSYWMHKLLFQTLGCDGVFTWYDALARRLDTRPPAGHPVVRAAQHCYADTVRFRPRPRKEAVIVYAARLIPVKRPLLFVEAMRLALQCAPQAFDGWRIEMYGRGVLEERVRAAIAQAGLEARIKVGFALDLATVFGPSRLFVSTQDYENYSSVAMLEALASGNAIIAMPVGQTEAFVKDGENGFLAAEDTPAALAAALVRYVSHPEMHERFAHSSRALVEQVHTFDNFAAELEGFWDSVLARRANSAGGS